MEDCSKINNKPNDMNLLNGKMNWWYPKYPTSVGVGNSGSLQTDEIRSSTLSK